MGAPMSGSPGAPGALGAPGAPGAPNHELELCLRYFVAKPSIVTIYALFERLSTKAILHWKSFQ